MVNRVLFVERSGELRFLARLRTKGPEPKGNSVEKGGDEVWIGEKFQSNPEIAGSPRNSFRASLMAVFWR